jgi:TPR repeat protein
VLGWLGLPAFYDKLLCVPPLNLMVPVLDRAGAAIDARIGGLQLNSPRLANFAHMGAWIALFAVMTGTGLVAGHHPGANSEFWSRACQEGRRNGCQTWVRTMTIACRHGSGSTCLVLARVLDEGQVVPRNASEAGKDLARACDLKIPGACASLVALVKRDGGDALRDACSRGDGESCFILASLHYAGGGVPKDYTRSAALFRQSCEQGWPRGCGGLGECYRAGQGTRADTLQAIHYFNEACREGIAASCYSAGEIYQGLREETLARRRFEQACESSLRSRTADNAYFRAAPGAEPAAAVPFCAQP